MAIDPRDFVGDLVADGTDTLIETNQNNNLIDEDVLSSPLVENGGDLDQDVISEGGSAFSGNGTTNAGGLNLTVGDDLKLTGTAAAAADAEAAARGFTQDIETGSNVQANYLNASVVGSNVSVNNAGEDNIDDGDPGLEGVTQLGPDGPIGGALSGLAFPTDGTGTDVEFHASQTNTLNDQDQVLNAEVINHDDGDGFDLTQDATALGGSAVSGIGTDIDGAPLFENTNVGDDMVVEGHTSASANATASLEAFSQDIDVGNNAQINSLSAEVVGGNQNIAQTGEDDSESVDLVSDNEDDTEIGFGTSTGEANGDGNIAQLNDLSDNEDGEFTVLEPIVQNAGDPTAEAAQTVTAIGGSAESDDGIDTDDGASAILSNVTVGDNLDVHGSASVSADAAATATAFTQNIVTGSNEQLNAFAASVVSGSQNDIDVGEDNAGSPGFSPATISPQDSVEELEDTDVRFDVDQANVMDDGDVIEDATVINGDIPDGGFDDGADLIQTATAIGGGGDDSDSSGASADDGIDADILGGNAIDIPDVGDDATITGSSTATANATAGLEAFTQDLDTGGNVQINRFDAEVIGGSQVTINVGEDDAEDLAAVVSDDGATVTTFDVSQSNNLTDTDVIEEPSVFNDAGSTVTQTTSAAGGVADADDGITAIASAGSFVNTPGATVGDDLIIDGSAMAEADAVASAAAFTQDLTTGGNAQLNDFQAGIVGASQNLTSIDGDNAGDAAGANSPLGGSGGPTVSDVNLTQSNQMDDGDFIFDPEVLNDYDPSAFGGPSGVVTQTVTAVGGIAPGIGFSGDAAGIDADGLDGALAVINVGDDATISGSTTASTDATARAEAFTQDISTGSNVQVNSVTASVIGGNQNGVITGEDDAEGTDLTAHADGETATTLGNFAVEDGVITEDDPIAQTNNLNDADLVISPIVQNEPGGLVEQNVSALGGEATVSDGITLGDSGTIASIAGEVGDDLNISGDASVSADALAYAESFTQDIVVGGNTQLNEFAGSVIGASENTYTAGGDDGGSGADDVDPDFVPPAFGLVEGTNTQISVVQSNNLLDDDVIDTPQVVNAGGPGVPEGIVLQNADAEGGISIAGDGIGGDGSGAGALVDGGSVVDDLTIAGDAAASANGVAALEAFTQDISTGGNSQFNVASVSIIGGSSSTLSAGEDDEAEGTLDIGNVNVLGGTDSAVHIVQSNGGDGPAIDADVIIDALVSNQSAGLAGDQGLEQDADASGGTSTAGSGVATAGGLVNADVGDDASIGGNANASSTAAAMTNGFTQGISTGINRQSNEVDAAIVGANRNANLTGGDDVAGGDDAMIAGLTGDADSLFLVEQNNALDDTDDIIDPVVASDGGDTVQNATADGGSAAAGYGVQATGAGGSGQTGDDFSINGQTIASADAMSDISVFTQDLSTGANVQANSASMSVVGLNDSLMFTGEDDGDDLTDLPALSSLVPTSVGEPDGETGSDGVGVDTTFDITQSNALVDNDTIFNPQVFSSPTDSDTVQVVSATGGTASTLDGVEGGAGGLFDSYSVLDDLSIGGVSEASASAYGAADAFTQNIVMGANVQVNAIDVSVVGGSTAVNVVGEDDLS